MRSRVSQTRCARMVITNALRSIPREWSKLLAALDAASKFSSPHVKQALVTQARAWCLMFPSTPGAEKSSLVDRIWSRCKALGWKLCKANGREAGWHLLSTSDEVKAARESNLANGFGPIGRRLVRDTWQSAGVSRVLRETVDGTRLETDPEMVYCEA
ncbi:hypothetical protein LPJ61_006273 [Coemansia biformis]|uniref:Uncharacterized protein n=1 Tax=Coemansia biformis TaxID=1286918 RepID=A0A9W8CQ07_9FUNG|nr:hypothetical protein LPJ61_006273 [Coemansia biformis]